MAHETPSLVAENNRQISCSCGWDISRFESCCASCSSIPILPRFVSSAKNSLLFTFVYSVSWGLLQPATIVPESSASLKYGGRWNVDKPNPDTLEF